MCGIVGGTRPDWQYEDAVAELRHRGPDQQRVVRRPMATLGFSRLAIVDLREVASQPMASDSRDCWLVFNGEIYGFRDLRRELISLGRSFRTTSDSEVLLQAYLEWGDSFVDRVDGMFAFAILDERSSQLKLFRDRSGIKPLYYYWDGKEFAFASELRALETVVGSEALSVDPTACYDFLTYRYIPGPKSLYRNVYKLSPGSRLVLAFDPIGIEAIDHYWKLSEENIGSFEGGLEAAQSEFDSLVTEAVDLQLVADVPVGFFLSGGLDSSLVVEAAAQTGKDLQTFSIGFEPESRSELPYSRLVATEFKTRHREEVYRQASFDDEFRRLKAWYGEPFADFSAFPTHCVSKMARESVTVALSGDGGDELFGGYRRYQVFERLRPLALSTFKPLAAWIDRVKSPVPPGSLLRRALNLASVVGDEDLALYTRMMSGMTRAEKSSWHDFLEIPDDYDDYWLFRKFWRPELPLRTRLQFLDFHTFLPDDILTKVDRVSMANSLEVRVPLLSRPIVEFAFSLPEQIRCPDGALKGFLKRAYRNRLPGQVLERPKKGFSIPREYSPAGPQRVQELVLTRLFEIDPGAG